MSETRLLILGRAGDLPPGEMRQVEVQGRKILLLRQGDDITALGAECPHAGGPLAEGILADGKIICPWHKAAFCARSGARVDPPAVDDLPAYGIDIQHGDIVLGDPLPGAGAAKPLRDARHFVILGAGAAGFSAAQELRRVGFSGAVTLISQEEELPYDRTVLSKYFLAGTEGGEKSPLQEEAYFLTHAIRRLRAEITSLDTRQKRVEFSDGTHLSYDSALIATGGAVVPPPFPGATLKNVFTLRGQKDATQILRAAEQAKRAVVIGASFIGMEVAAALRERGLEVTVAAPQSTPLSQQLGDTIGEIYRKIHEEKGTIFRLGTQIARLSGIGWVDSVLLEDGESLPADLVVLGLGVKPATGFTQDLTRDDDHAFEVDAQLRVEQDVYAAGDIAAFPIYGNGARIRVEHWRVAEQHGIIAARNMAGIAEAYREVPYFWTIQYMIRLDYVGHASAQDEQVIRGDPATRNFIAYYLRGGFVAAAAGMNRDSDMASILALMRRKQSWRLDELHPGGSSPAAVLRAQGL